LLEALAGLDADRAKKLAKDILLNGPKNLKQVALKVWSEQEEK
jgi:hypothetical protein